MECRLQKGWKTSRVMVGAGSVCCTTGSAPEKKNSSKVKPKLVIPSTLCVNTHYLPSYLRALIDIEKKRQGQKIENSTPLTPHPSPKPHRHHHFHHYMKYDREQNPTMPCKCRRELASRRHKRYACIIWPGEHHLWETARGPKEEKE